MEQSESINELATALAKAQAEIRNPGKNTKNTFFKNEYADLTAVLGCIRPVASANGLSFIQAVEAKAGHVCVSSQISHSSCLLYTSPSPRDGLLSRMPSSA